MLSLINYVFFVIRTAVTLPLPRPAFSHTVHRSLETKVTGTLDTRAFLFTRYTHIKTDGVKFLSFQPQTGSHCVAGDKLLWLKTLCVFLLTGPRS